LSKLALGGCVSGIAGNDANIYNSLNGQRIVGNENLVIVSNVWNEMDAFPLAERHCKNTVDRRGSGRSTVLRLRLIASCDRRLDGP
jgi:hypothetical protein